MNFEPTRFKFIVKTFFQKRCKSSSIFGKTQQFWLKMGKTANYCRKKANFAN